MNLDPRNDRGQFQRNVLEQLRAIMRPTWMLLLRRKWTRCSSHLLNMGDEWRKHLGLLRSKIKPGIEGVHAVKLSQESRQSSAPILDVDVFDEAARSVEDRPAFKSTKLRVVRELIRAIADPKMRNPRRMRMKISTPFDWPKLGMGIPSATPS